MTRRFRSPRFVFRDGKLHRTPQAGYLEYQVSDRTCAENRHLVSKLKPRSLDSMHYTGMGVHESPLLVMK